MNVTINKVETKSVTKKK